MSFRADLEGLILGTLQAGELHGYEIAKRIQNAAPQVLSVGEGRLYPALHRLERDGYVVATWHQNEGKPARKVYRLTDKGNSELVKRRLSWEEFSRGVGFLLQAPRGEVSRG